MKQLVLVRHGSYSSKTGGLNDEGRAQIAIVSERLKEIIDSIDGSRRVLIFCSPTGRTRETAQILGAALGVDFEEHFILTSSEKEVQHDFPDTLQLVRSRKDDADIIILVTHAGHVEGFPPCYSEKELGLSPVIEYRGMAKACFKGEARILDCGQGLIVRVL